MTSASRRAHDGDRSRPGTAELPLAIWPCAQQTSQQQRRDRYLPESNRHPGKMLPELARRAIAAYSRPGDLVLDPMCGIGTTLVEAIHLRRRALGIELEQRWAALATANLAHARTQGARGQAGVIEGNASDLARLLTLQARDLVAPNARAGALPYGRVDLVLTSPPYACEVGELDKNAWGSGSNLCRKEDRNYSRDRGNLGHARSRGYLDAMAGIYQASAAVLKPGGFLISVTKELRGGGALHNLAGNTIRLCERTGLRYWQHVIALLATIRDDDLVARPSFWQRTQTRKALERGDPVALVVHEDVLVFRKPTARARAGTPDNARQGRLAA
jgi:DNA modification methylase